MNQKTRKKLTALDRIAAQLVGIHSEDLTTAETNILCVLVDEGILTFNKEREVCYTGNKRDD